MAKKRIIGLDFDDILMDFNAAFLDYHNSHHYTDLTRDKITTYYIEELLGCTKEDFEKRIVNFYHSDTHNSAYPIDGAVEAIKKLAKDNSLVVITSRPDFIKEATMTWLKKHYGDLIGDVCFTNLFQGNGIRKTKAEACKELGVDVFIDDHFDYAENVAKSGIKVLLFDAPWNQTTELHPNITRVQSWDHILQILL